MWINFRSYPAVATAKFTCPFCGKPNRTRTFRIECTVNPFNRTSDGHVRTPAEVRAQSSEQATAMRDEFACKPICKKCEDGLSFKELQALREERKGLIAA